MKPPLWKQLLTTLDGWFFLCVLVGVITAIAIPIYLFWPWK